MAGDFKMRHCFVIQPFDDGEYDKRYRETYLPAIRAAGYEPYRVDEDSGASVPIAEIEGRIANADVCFADVTVDNPNVWLEVGLAIAGKKDLCLICSRSRNKLPFDIHHRQVHFYSTQAASDFVDLQQAIEKRLVALSVKSESLSDLLEKIASAEFSQSGLSQLEIAVLGVVASEQSSASERISLVDLRLGVDKQGFTAIAGNIGIKMLIQKGYLETLVERGKYSQESRTFEVTTSGWSWLYQNIESFNTRKEQTAKSETLENLEDDAYFRAIEPKSTPMTLEEAQKLLRRIDEKSVEFLAKIVANNGFATWPEMRKIFALRGLDWTGFSSHYGKGITNAFRSVIHGGQGDRLVIWNDEDPAWHDRSWSKAKVFVTGEALVSLTKAFS